MGRLNDYFTTVVKIIIVPLLHYPFWAVQKRKQLLTYQLLR